MNQKQSKTLKKFSNKNDKFYQYLKKMYDGLNHFDKGIFNLMVKKQK